MAENTELFGNSLEETLIADVLRMQVFDGKGNVLLEDKLTEANVSMESATNDVTGGQRDQLLAILHGRQEIEISTNAPNFNFKSLALHTGSDIVTGSGKAYAIPKWYQVEDGGFTLDHTPIQGTVIVAQSEDGELVDVLNEGKEVTVTDVADGKHVNIVAYEYKTPAKTQEIAIDTTKFPKNAKIVLTTMEIGFDEQPLNYIQFEFPVVKPSATFSFNTSSERSASPRENTFRVMKPRFYDRLGTVKRIPLTETP